jgi:hypothetical protein
MYKLKDIGKALLGFTVMFSILTGFMMLNGLHYAGWF